MRIFDFRKYFFSYIYTFLGIIIIISNIAADIFLEPASTHITHEPMPAMVRNKEYSIISTASSLLYICCCGALIIEIIIRFIIKKIFPNLKFLFNITIPNTLNKILSIVFYICFLISSLPLLNFLVSWCLIIKESQ